MNEIMHVNGTDLTVRPVEFDDVERLARMFDRLSPDSVRYRFFSPLPRLPRPMLLQMSHVDHWRRDALVALDGDEIVADARYGVTPGSRPGSLEAELAVTVEDAWQNLGLGRRLTRRLTEVAVGRGYDAFVARILPDNRASLSLVHAVFPSAVVRLAGSEYEAHLPLKPVLVGATG